MKRNRRGNIKRNVGPGEGLPGETQKGGSGKQETWTISFADL